MKVTIGVDPHKGSHTAVAVDDGETELARVKVRTSSSQLEQLLAWAEPFEKRTWAVEAAGGWGYLVSQQLAAAGEEVFDVPATLAARVRLLGSGRSNKNDPNDARSVAIAAMRAPNLAGVHRADHTGVLRLLAKRTLTWGDPVAASKTTLTELFGVGPVVAAMAKGYAGDVLRFRSRNQGKTKKEALRALKRRISDAIYRQLLIDTVGR